MVLTVNPSPSSLFGTGNARVSKQVCHASVAVDLVERERRSDDRRTFLRWPKLFRGGELSMPRRRLHANSAVISGKFSPLQTGLSTCVFASTHVRDRQIVTAYSTGSYLTTGVETRTLTDCAPATALPVTQDLRTEAPQSAHDLGTMTDLLRAKSPHSSSRRQFA
jgi:hypothetical protein